MWLDPWVGRSPGGANATHASIPAWEIPWAAEPGGLQCMSRKESDRTEHTHIFYRIKCKTLERERNSIKNIFKSISALFKLKRMI